MCGGFPLHLAKPQARGPAVLRQVLFVSGKCFTYVFLGALAASLGVVLLKNTSLAGIAPAMRIAAGVVTLVFGVGMLGVRWPFNKHDPDASARKASAEASGFWTSALGGLVRAPGPGAAFVLGLGVGFLPCPLPIGMLAVAVGTHSVPHGMALMAGVGLGTMPGLLGVGLFGMGLDWKLKRTGMRAAGALVVLIGALTLFRASGLMPKHHPVDKVVPPCCQEHGRK